MIRVELFESARQMAGVAVLEVEAETLAEALAGVARAYPALEPRVIENGALAPHWRANLNGRTFVEDPTTPLLQGDTILIVSALAGG